MNSGSDNDLASLLRAAGVRVQGPEQMSPEVRAAVEAEWQATRAARLRRRRRVAWTSAAIVVAAAAIAWLARPLYVRSDEPLAAPAEFKGAVEFHRDGREGWKPLTSQMMLKSGDSVRTRAGGRVGLKLVSGVTLELDGETRIDLDDPLRAELRRGGVYVDSGPVSAQDLRKLRLKTPAGVVKHFGARYEARIAGDAVVISVRDGRVSIGLPDGDVSAVGGERLSIEDSQVERRALPAGDSAWAWLSR